MADLDQYPLGCTSGDETAGRVIVALLVVVFGCCGGLINHCAGDAGRETTVNIDQPRDGWTETPKGDGSFMLTWVPSDAEDDAGGREPTALLTVRGKDHSMNAQHLDELARACDRAIESIRCDRRPSVPNYEIVWYVIDPFIGWRVPISALVRETRNAPPIVVHSRKPWRASHVGEKSAAAIRLIRESIDQRPDEVELIGPQVVVSGRKFLPAGVDPASFVQDMLP